MPELILP